MAKSVSIEAVKCDRNIVSGAHTFQVEAQDIGLPLRRTTFTHLRRYLRIMQVIMLLISAGEVKLSRQVAGYEADIRS